MESKKTTWKELLKKLRKSLNDTGELIFNEDDLSTEVELSSGSGPDKHFTAWSKNYVFFSKEYDGYPSVGYVLRNPNYREF